ncbi:hypothetical protein BsWGS_29105 [Bradybaena similaris]
MIESVQARQRGAIHFEDHYDNLCALQDSAPLPAVKAHLAKGVIDLNGDRVRLNDWSPIINTIKINKSLQFIAVRSYCQVPASEDGSRATALKHKLPAIRSKEITHRLMKALKDCLLVSPTLSCIELQGLALRHSDLMVLVKGFSKSQTLRHLSLEQCRIGDKGLEALCSGLKNSKFINSVNLSGCSITPSGAEALAGVIKHQGMQRHSEAWQDSLRYRRPDLSRMSGIRRITANNNPMLGDEGAQVLAEALRDDLWLKAIDLQACGIGNQGARSFLEVLNFNTSLVVLDIRRNPLVDGDIVRSVMERLALNSSRDDQEYKWMKVDPPEKQSVKQTAKPRRKATKVLNSSFGKKTTIKNYPGTSSCTCCGRVTTGSCRHKVRGSRGMARQEISPIPGLPWRTAARADRFRGHPPDTLSFLTEESADATTSTANENANNSMSVPGICSTPHHASVYSGDQARMKNTEAMIMQSMGRLHESHKALDFTNRKAILVELEQIRRQLHLERLARARADEQVITLAIENQRLTEEINCLRAEQKSSSIANDESFLESVEMTFKQFHSFIDLLEVAGLGELVSIAGLDLTQMPIINRNNNSVSNGRHKLSVSQANNSLYTAASFQSIPVGASDFGNGHHKPIGQAAAVPGDSSAVASKKPASSTQPELTRSQYMQSSIYDVESEAARLEADELYSRLVQDTLVGLGQADDPSGGGATRAGRTDESADLAEGSERFENDSVDFMRSATRHSFLDSSRVPSGGESPLNIRDKHSDDHLYTTGRRESGQSTTDLGSPFIEIDS